jgi:hypothetical protein
MSHPHTAPRASRLLTSLVLGIALVGMLAFVAPESRAEDTAPESPAVPLRVRASTPAELSRIVDQGIAAAIAKADVEAAPRSSDAEFLRRIHLDLVGSVPSATETRRFLADKSPDKRNRVIEELLASEDHAAHFAVVWFKTLTGLTPGARGQGNAGQGGRYVQGKPGEMFVGWLTEQMAENRPYNEFVYDLLTAAGRSDENGATGFVARWSENVNNLASAASKTFLGTRIQCAQCHDHIYEEDWKQKDFKGMAAFFATMRAERAPEYRELQQLRRKMEEERVKQRQAKQPGADVDDLGQGDGMDAPGGDAPSNDGGEMDAPESGAKRPPARTRTGPYAGMSPKELREAMQKLQGARTTLIISDATPGSRDMIRAKQQMERIARRNNGTLPERIRSRLELFATAPKFWLDTEVQDVPGIPRRLLLARWITSDNNKAFAQTIVNRYWGYFTGRGFVDPVDDFNSFNEASHPQLLDHLAEDFVRNGFDLKRLIRVIVGTEAYQRSSRWTSEEVPESQLYAKAPVRQLTTEQLYHALMRATGIDDQMKRGNRGAARRIQQAIFSVFSFVFDDDEGKEEQDFEGSIPQGLFLMNGELMQQAVAARRGSMLERLLRIEKDPAKRVEQLYLAAYSRFPESKERKAAVRFLGSAGGEAQAYEDFFWALLNSAEFMTNH